MVNVVEYEIGIEGKHFFAKIFLLTFDLFLTTHRLHREALKQSATDPKTGLIDINILTTGLSVSDRKRRLEIAKSLKELLQSKGKAPSVKYQQTYEELKEASDLVSEDLIYCPFLLSSNQALLYLETLTMPALLQEHLPEFKTRNAIYLGLPSCQTLAFQLITIARVHCSTIK